MSPRPRWLARLLGSPGATSFDRFAPAVHDATATADDVAALGEEALREAARRAAPGAVDASSTSKLAWYLAVSREAASRSLGLRAYDEQLFACAALLTGSAVELDTGEGKSLVGALAAAGYALAGRRVHLLTINDYLAGRDAELFAPFFELLGVTVGVVRESSSPDERRAAYRADIVFAAVSEVGYDVLRDRFVVTNADRVAPASDVVIVDEADAVMIDEAMSPLVLAGSSPDDAEDFVRATELVRTLREGRDYEIDAERQNATLTDAGLERIERSLGGVDLYEAEHTHTLTLVTLALHARTLVRRDVDYVVTDGVVRLVNAGRGRVAERQRWPDGLHAAVEAKEGLEPTAPGIVLDSMTLQELIGRYERRSGMSGTVLDVAEEFVEFYDLGSGRIERHEPNARTDAPDRVLVDEAEKTAEIVAEVTERNAAGQPVLVGTQSVAESEELADRLRDAGLEPRVLNAKNDADEAGIVARAGEPGAITISTQMSGRGTDIRLGGPDERDRDEVVAAGGLAVVATSRYPSKRLDAQLRGRAGRQGDPGDSIAFASLEDEIVTANAPSFDLARIRRDAPGLGDERRRHLVSGAQTVSEGARRDRHRATWRYARAISLQRAALVRHRDIVLDDVAGADAALDALRPHATDAIDALVAAAARERVARRAREILLHTLDEHWTNHLALLGEIRDGIHLRALGGQDPADEFHTIALREFNGLPERANTAAAAVLAGLSVDDLDRDLADLGLVRPSATWTYMVSDDPLGSSGDRAVRALGGFWRSRVLGIE